MHPSKLDICLIVFFLAALCAPTVDSYCRPDSARGPEAAELRKAEPRPVFELTEDPLSFPDHYAKYFDDSFGLRDVFLRWYSIEKLFGFGVSASPLVTMGRDQWMFYVKEFSMENFRGVMPFSPEELERWRRGLESRRDYLARRGIEYLYVLCPNKESIYPEYLHPEQNRVGPTRMDQLVAYLAQHSTFRILDLRPALIAAREGDAPDEHLYFELGTHWNGRGGFVAGREIQKVLHERFPAVHVTDASEVKREVLGDRGDSEARRMYIEDLVPQIHTWYFPVERRARKLSSVWDSDHPWILEVDDPSLPSAVIFHDSFGPSVEFLIGDCCRRSMWVHRGTFDTALIEAEKPSVVISLYVERALMSMAPPIVKEPPPPVIPPEREWESARDVRFRFDPNAETSGLKAQGRMELVRDQDFDGSFATLVLNDGADMLLLPEIAWPSEGRLLVQADITAPATTLLSLFYLGSDNEEYTRRASSSVTLHRGRNRVLLEIPTSGLHGRLKLRPGAELGRYELRGLEVRAASAH